MLQAHSILWHYLWIAPSVILLILAGRMGQLRLHAQYPLFFAFALTSAIEQLTLYACDLVPSIEALTWWRVFLAGLLVEGILKFALVGRIFAHVFGNYATVANLSKLTIRGVGASLALAAVAAAAWASTVRDSSFGIVNGAHRTEQAVYLIEAGLLLSIFLLSSYFHLSFSRPLFGIALGLSISACVHLATWALVANAGLPTSKRIQLDFVNMATYHVCVLIWCYYLLVPAKAHSQTKLNSNTKTPTLPQEGPGANSSATDEIEVWNEEMERLLHR